MLSIEKLLLEKRAQSEWNSLYMLIVLIIVALILITIIKPMFKQSQQVVKPIKQATSAASG
jgi:competence protein ComGC